MHPKNGLMIVVVMVGLLAGCAPAETPAPSSPPTAVPTDTATAIPATTETAAPRPVSPTDTAEPAAVVTSEPAIPGAQPGEPQPWAPAPGDSQLSESKAFAEKLELLTLESYPPQFRLYLAGALPTPCHRLRVRVNPPVNGVIQVDLYSVVDPGMICVQVLEPFDVTVPLEGMAAGIYSVRVNDQTVGEILVP